MAPATFIVRGGAGAMAVSVVVRAGPRTATAGVVGTRAWGRGAAESAWGAVGSPAAAAVLVRRSGATGVSPVRSVVVIP
jgi:hypothetical protein